MSSTNFLCATFFGEETMSQIYDKYKELKTKNKEIMYLFRSGNFYIFLDEDADKINEYVVLKRTKFCKEAMKCGFPISSLDEYLKVFNNHGLTIKVVEQMEENSLEQAIERLNRLDLDKTTPIKALNILKELKELIN